MKGIGTSTKSVRSKDENPYGGLLYFPINQPLMISWFEL
jgi:hypothetical protein